MEYQYLNGTDSRTGDTMLSSAVQEALKNGLKTDINMNNYQLTNLGNATSAKQAYTKAQVDQIISQIVGGASFPLSLNSLNDGNILNGNIDLTLTGNPDNFKLLVENATVSQQAVSKQQMDTADSLLQTNINTEITARSTADALLQTNIDTEATARATADNVLATAIDVVKTDIIAIKQDIVDIEAQQATTALTLTDLQTDLNTESTARSTADTLLQTNIDTETTNRTTADALLQTNINSEITNRITADTALQTQITTIANKEVLDIVYDSGHLFSPYDIWTDVNSSSRLATENYVYTENNLQTIDYNTKIQNLDDRTAKKRLPLESAGTIGGDLHMSEDPILDRPLYRIYNLPQISHTAYTGLNALDKTQPITADSLPLWPINALQLPTADLSLNSKKITGLADAVDPTDAVTKQQLDSAIPTVQADRIKNSTGKSQILCSGDNAIQIKSNDVLIGTIQQSTGQAGYTPFNITSVDRLQLVSPANSISLSGSKAQVAQPAVNSHTASITMSENFNNNQVSQLQIGSNGATTQLLNLSSGHLNQGLGMQNFSAINNSPDQLQQTLLLSAGNPMTDPTQYFYSTSFATTIGQTLPIQFDSKTGYTASPAVTITDNNQFASKLYTDNQVATKLAGTSTLSDIQTANPTATDISLGDFCINSTKAITGATQYATKQYVDDNAGGGGSGESSIACGSIIAWLNTVIPENWLLCDGSTFDELIYPDLYVILGNTNILPDLRGRFLRGLDTSGIIDTQLGRSLGGWQDDSIKAHTHPIWSTVSIESTKGDPNSIYEGGYSGGGGAFYKHPNSDFNTGSATETRVRNTAVHYIIRATITGSSQVYGINSSVANIDLASTYKVINSINPTSNQDLATKYYVDQTDAVLNTYINLKRNSADSLQAIFNSLPSALDTSTYNISTADPSSGRHLVTLDYYNANLPNPSAVTLIQNVSNPASFVSAGSSSIILGGTPLDLNSQQIIGLSPGTLSGHAITLGQLNAKTLSALLLGQNTLSIATNALKWRNSNQFSDAFFIDANTFLHEKNISDNYIYDYSTATTLMRQSQSGNWLRNPLIIGQTSTSVAQDAQLWIKNSQASTKIYSLFIDDADNTHSAYFNCYSQFVYDQTHIATSNINMSGSSILMTESGNSPFIKIRNGNISGWALPVDATALQIGFKTDTNDLVASFSGMIEAFSYNTIVPVSMRQYKRDIQVPVLNDLHGVQMYKFYFDIDKLVEDGFENADQMSKEQQTGFIVDTVPERYHKPTKQEGFTTIDYTRLKDDLFVMLLQKVQDQECRLKQLEAIVFGKMN